MINKELIIRNLKNKIQENIKKLGDVPEFLIPKIDESNDFAYPYIDVSNSGVMFIVIRERGIEYRRDLYTDIDILLEKIFEMVIKELAIEQLKTEHKNLTSFTINHKQQELMKLLNSNQDL